MNHSWKLMVFVCLAVMGGVGVGIMSMTVHKVNAASVTSSSKVSTPWKDTFGNLGALAVLLREGSNSFPNDILKVVGPLGDSLINTARLAGKFAELIETNRLLAVMQALQCVIQDNKLLIKEAQKFKKSGKSTSQSGCPEMGCINKRVCLALNVKLLTEMVKEITDILLGSVKKNDEGKKVFISGLLYNDIEFFHNSIDAALSVNDSLKIFPADARALVDTFLLKTSAFALKNEPQIAKTVEMVLDVLSHFFPVMIGGEEYLKQQRIPKDAAQKLLQKSNIKFDDESFDLEAKKKFSNEENK